MFHQQKRRTASHSTEHQSQLWDEISLLASAALLAVAVVLILGLLAIYPAEPPAQPRPPGR